MLHDITKKSDSVMLVLTSQQLDDAYELGQLEKDLKENKIAHSITWSPPKITISLSGEFYGS